MKLSYTYNNIIIEIQMVPNVLGLFLDLRLILITKIRPVVLKIK